MNEDEATSLLVTIPGVIMVGIEVLLGLLFTFALLASL